MWENVTANHSVTLNLSAVLCPGKEAAEGGQEDGGSRVGEREREGGVREDCPLPGPRGARQSLQPPPQVALPLCVYLVLIAGLKNS